MSGTENTLFLRLAGPMQSWGTSSRFQLRRTDAYPSKSGVLGLLLCAMGVCRKDSTLQLEPLVSLLMGVRVDRRGRMDWDFQTAGAKIGIRTAEGKIKRTATTNEYETLLSRRQYLYDSSFLVALQGNPDTICQCVDALDNPVWPIYLGRKCCIPGEPVFAGVGSFNSLIESLSSVPWRPRNETIDRNDRSATRTLDAYIEHQSGTPPPADARLVHDVPQTFGFYSHGSRWIVAGEVTVPVGEATQTPPTRPGFRPIDYTSPQWKEARLNRMIRDNHLCVFCKSPAVQVHHVDYANVGRETDSDLRSLCKICHDACTMLEYGHDMRRHRIDPSDPAQRQLIIRQIDRLIIERRQGRRRELLENARNVDDSFFVDIPTVSEGKGH